MRVSERDYQRTVALNDVSHSSVTQKYHAPGRVDPNRIYKRVKNKLEHWVFMGIFMEQIRDNHHRIKGFFVGPF